MSSSVCCSKMRSFASAYHSNVPWRSRWSGSRLRSTATRGRSVSTSSSWNEESSQTIQASGATLPTSDVSGRPMLPATSTGRPGRAEDRAEELRGRRLAVRARHAEDRVRQEPRAELDLAPHGIARDRAPATSERLARDARALHDADRSPVSNVSSSRPRWTSTPSSRSLPASMRLVAVVPDDLRALPRRAPQRPPVPSARARPRGRAGRAARSRRLIAGRTGGSRGRRARTRSHRGSRTRSRSAP